MDELIPAICTFLEKEPEKRYGELMEFVRFCDVEHVMSSLAIILPVCTNEEKEILAGQLEQDEILSISRLPRGLLPLFFKDVAIEAGPEAISTLCCTMLKSTSPEIRKNMLFFIEEGFVPVNGSVFRGLLLALGDPEEEIRQNAAEILSCITISENVSELRTEQMFFSTFYMGDLQAGKHLAEKISTQQDAVTFLFLCFSQSLFGTAKNNNPDFSKELAKAFYFSSEKSKIDFHEALDSALNLYCLHARSLSGFKQHEKKVLRRALRKRFGGIPADNPDRFQKPGKPTRKSFPPVRRNPARNSH